MNLDIDALRTFSILAQNSSFTKTAQAVSRTQSTVSMQIKKLEDRLGFLLFERTRRTFVISDRGKQLLPFAQELLRIHDAGVRQALSDSVSGEIRMGITDYFLPESLAQVLAKFYQSYPQVKVHVTTGITAELLVKKRDGELDVVIGRRDLGSKAGEPIMRERLVWVAAPHFSLKRDEEVPLVMLPHGCGIRALVVKTLRKSKRAGFITFCGPSVLSLHGAIAAGLGVGCLTQGSVRDDFKRLGVKDGLPALPDSELVLHGPSSAALANRPSLSDLTDLIRDHLTAPMK
jgi:DNA-binding transcriptional LysR family regulator